MFIFNKKKVKKNEISQDERFVYDLVTSYPKISQHLTSNPEDIGKILENIDEIKGTFKRNLASWSVKIIDKTLLRLYDKISFEYPTTFHLPSLEKNNHIILVPNHQSHADYVALNYIWYKTFDRPVFIAGGINLNIFLLGNFFRNMGAFFIRRSFQHNPIYKMTFEAYIFYLLKTDKMIEFFFEGGRSRTGKLLSPKFGLFQMLVEAHAELCQQQKKEEIKPLLFLPISIAHEHIPEEKAHARELDGAKKKQESLFQVLKILNLLNKKMGIIHIKMGEGIVIHARSSRQEPHEIKRNAQELAFKCFISVGNGMPVSAVSLVALLLLDAPSGAQTWDDLYSKAKDVMAFCDRFGISLAKELIPDQGKLELKRALEMLRTNGKLQILERPKLGKVFYTIKSSERVHVCYFKNMIIHHFLVASIINSAWFNIFTGSIKNSTDLYQFLLARRQELKFEFYLPTASTMLREALEIISYSVGRKMESLDECMQLGTQELYLIASKVRPFSTALSSLYESYYVAACTLRYFISKNFSEQDFLLVARDLHEMEIQYGRVVQYPESFLAPVLKDSLKYFVHEGVLNLTEGLFTVISLDLVDKYCEKFARDINDQVTLNLKRTSLE